VSGTLYDNLLSSRGMPGLGSLSCQQGFILLLITITQVKEYLLPAGLGETLATFLVDAVGGYVVA
jgi:hypothetical protein